MQVAEVLADLTSLYVCDHEAAVKVVSAHQPQSSAAASPEARPPLPHKQSSTKAVRIENADGDGHLQRALDLVNLHAEMKERHGKGAEMDQVLTEARRKVERVYREVAMRE